MGSDRLSVTVLGCNGSFPGASGACSGYLLRAGDTNVWIDAGSGTMANLQTFISLDQLDAVIVSHEHPDHWTDLEGLAIAFKWALRRRGPTVFGPRGLRDLLRVGPAVDAFDWQAIDENSLLLLGGIRVSFSRTDHSVPTFAVRAEYGGRNFGYSADTGPRWGLPELGDDLHLALCEATFLADGEGTVQHMSARQAGASAAAAKVQRLIITHLTPGVDPATAGHEAASAFGKSVEVATLGAQFEV